MMLLRGSLALAVVLCGFAAGCRTVNKGITEAVLERGKSDEWHVHYGNHSHYTLTNDIFEGMEFEGVADVNGLAVHYPPGLAPQAQSIAGVTANLLRRVQQRLGITITTGSTLHLLRFDRVPQYFDIELEVEPNEFPLPLFVQAGQESWESILMQNPAYPYVFVHELVETSLVSRQAHGRVLPDLAWGPVLLKAHVNNYTRWFRDGLANYAGYVAYETFAEEIVGSERLRFQETALHTRPFSSLAMLRGKLFSWPQSSRTRDQRLHYNAALGLFLFIAEQFGEEAIREINAEIARRQVVDGRDLREITSQVLGTDVKEFVNRFEFPRTGLHLERVTPARALNHGLEVREGLLVEKVEPNSIAAEAGLQDKDIIVTADGAATVNQLDFELALLRARTQDALALTIQRKDTGTLTLEMPLRAAQSSLAQRPVPGRRHKPLKKGRTEFLSSFPLFF